MIVRPCTSAAPIGMPPSRSPRSASLIAALRKPSKSSIVSNSSIREDSNHSSVSDGTRFAVFLRGGETMLHMALVFLVIGVIAALLGFTTIAGASFAVAKFLAGLFLILFLVFLIIALSAANRVVR